jgi:hypothetical protein
MNEIKKGTTVKEKMMPLSKCASRTIRRSNRGRAFEFCLQHQVQTK